MRRSLLFALALAGCASSPPSPAAPAATTASAAPAVDCGPVLPGSGMHEDAPLVVVGEMHGQVGPPAFAGNLACREAQRTATGATLALEISYSEQPRIDAFLASDGGPNAKAALLAGHFWTREIQDGRSSAAMAALLERVRAWKAAGLPLRVAAIAEDKLSEAETGMASRLVALVKANAGPVVMLVGNAHARTIGGVPWDAKLTMMAGIAKRDVPKLVSLDERYEAGESWVCFTPDPNECGAQPLGAKGSGTPGRVELFPHPDEHGYDGTFFVGKAEASEPAVGLTTAQRTANVVARFRAANRPLRDDDASESAMSADARAEWCKRLLPLAQAHVPLDGERMDALGACDAALVPTPQHQLVPDVKLKLDVGFFFARPTLSASYDRETRTLFLPLDATYAPWTDRPTVKHEWLHARHHANARNGDARAAALMTSANGFMADELPASLCDAVSGRPSRDRIEHAQKELQKLRSQLDALAASRTKAKQTRAGVVGTTFVSADGVERWVGGKDPKKSLQLLEGVSRDASTALAALSASPPDVAAAKAVPLVAGNACDPSQ